MSEEKRWKARGGRQEEEEEEEEEEWVGENE